MVTVQPTASAALRAGTDREAAFAAAQVDIGWRAPRSSAATTLPLGLALDRIGAWQRRLLAGSPMLAAQQRELATLRALALRHDSPLAGSSCNNCAPCAGAERSRRAAGAGAMLALAIPLPQEAP